jgi:hypothetical protein
VAGGEVDCECGMYQCSGRGYAGVISCGYFLSLFFLRTNACGVNGLVYFGLVAL